MDIIGAKKLPVSFICLLYRILSSVKNILFVQKPGLHHVHFREIPLYIPQVHKPFYREKHRDLPGFTGKFTGIHREVHLDVPESFLGYDFLFSKFPGKSLYLFLLGTSHIYFLSRVCIFQSSQKYLFIKW